MTHQVLLPCPPGGGLQAVYVLAKPHLPLACFSQHARLKPSSFETATVPLFAFCASGIFCRMQ